MTSHDVYDTNRLLLPFNFWMKCTQIFKAGASLDVHQATSTSSRPFHYYAVLSMDVDIHQLSPGCNLQE